LPPVSSPLVIKYGSLWARNRENLKRLRVEGRLFGVYVLCDGSMPVYIGRGRLWRRITRHRASKSRKRHFWDHFSWYAVPDRRFETDIEALLLRMLPFYLRSLNKQQSRFANAVRLKEENAIADVIRRPHFITARRRG
jgi:hypothetical protein